MPVLLLVIGCILGGALGWSWAHGRAATQIARLDATLRAAQDGEARLTQSVQLLSHETATQHQAGLSQILRPLQETLERYERRSTAMESERVDAYAQLRTEVQQLQAVSGAVATSTGQLVSALRAPQVRGRWGEHQLRRVVEAAGMLEHCDFNEQVAVTTDAGGARPDLVVHLSGGRDVVVDAKAPLDAYLTAMEAADESARATALSRHAKHLRGHVETLGAKAYWSGFTCAPEFVVLFVPADTFLDAALKVDPMLLEFAFAHNVVVATPATLVALLRTVAYTWRQEALTKNALAVQALGRELYTRLSTMVGHVSKVGSSLGATVTAYNKAIGSLETRVMVSARRFAELGVSNDPIDSPAPVDSAPRQPHLVEFDEPGSDLEPGYGVTAATPIGSRRPASVARGIDLNGTDLSARLQPADLA